MRVISVQTKVIFILLLGFILLSNLVSPTSLAKSKTSRSRIPHQNSSYHNLAGGPLTQNWSNTSLISINDNWSSVPSIVGYRGDGLTGVDDVDPQTVLGGGGTPVDVIANQTATGLSTGGVAEFEISDPVVAFQGSATADAPYLLLHLNTTNVLNVRVRYVLRDIDTLSTATQQVALHYRVGTSGNFINVPSAYVGNANNGGTRSINVVLPDEVEGQSRVQVRIMTTNASGSDAFIGIDDISISATPDDPPEVTSTTPSDGATGIAVTVSPKVRFSESVVVSNDWFRLNCPISGVRRPSLGNITVSGGPTNFTLNPTNDFAKGETCTLTIERNEVVDQDGAPDQLSSDHSFSFTTIIENADLSLTVKVDDSAPSERDQINYTVTLENNASSNSDATGIVVQGRLPDPTIEIENISNSCGASLVGRVMTWSVGTLNIGDKTSCTISASVRVNTNGSDFNFRAQVLEVNENDTDSNPGNLSGAPAEDDEDGVTVTVSGFSAVCDDPAKKIHDIQGSGLTSPMVGSIQTIEGVVVGEFQNTTRGLSGFFLQEEDSDVDSDAKTAEGIFVFDNGFGVEVNEGQVIRTTGRIQEEETFSGSGIFRTELANISRVIVCSDGEVATAKIIHLPMATADDWEAYEGMLVSLPQTLAVTNHFELGTFGRLSLAYGGRLIQPTQIVTPGLDAINFQQENDRHLIILDDGNNQTYPDPIPFPPYGLSATTPIRAGDQVSGLVGIIDQRATHYHLQPTSPPTFTPTNLRPPPPAINGRLTVATFNLNNYFNSFTNCQGGIGGASIPCRGAESSSEFNRQRAKLIEVLIKIDADIVGLVELENDGYGADSAIQDLVNGLNEQLGVDVYRFINSDEETGTINSLGTDAIKVGLIYRPSIIDPVGQPVTKRDEAFLSYNRPPLAQTFREITTNETFTIVVNHFKSKATSAGETDDADSGDGQGLSNGTRTKAAEDLVTWLATDPTGSKDTDILLIGDFNAYAQEDPIRVLEEGDYANQVARFNDLHTSSFGFQGQWGTLDYVLATSDLQVQITDARVWAINADEPILLDYNENNKTIAQLETLYNPDVYRSSDHDPLLVGLTLGPKLAITKSVFPKQNVTYNGMITYSVVLSNSGLAPAQDVSLTDTLSISSSFVSWLTAPIESKHTAGMLTWQGHLSANSQLEFTYVTQHMGGYEDTLSNVAQYHHSSSQNRIVVTTTIEANEKIIYLPTVFKQVGTTAPDLIIEQLITYRDNITIVLKNQGTTPVVDAFWVDVYLNPDVAPTQVNQTWEKVGDEGLVWGVTNLPILVGETITLTIGDATYRADLSRFVTDLQINDKIYAQVDSANLTTTYGGVLEWHELMGEPYNNIKQTTVATTTSVITRQNRLSSLNSSALPHRP